MRKLAKIISPEWHSASEGRAGIKPVGVQKDYLKAHKKNRKSAVWQVLAKLRY